MTVVQRSGAEGVNEEVVVVVVVVVEEESSRSWNCSSLVDRHLQSWKWPWTQR